MKKILALTLALIMLLSLAACKKDPAPVETTPITTAPPATAPIEEPPEIIPDIEDETMPPVLTDDMTGSDLRKLYANFMRDYDWSQHNGFTSETASTTFTYIFTDEGMFKEAKRKSELYEGSYLSRYVISSQNDICTSFVMYDEGSFGITEEYQFTYPNIWNLYKGETISEYTRTKISDRIYDIITFETTWGGLDDYFMYTVKDVKTDDIYIPSSYEGSWYVYSATDEQDYYDDIFFDVDAKILTIGDKKIQVEILVYPEENNAQYTNTIRGMLYVDRETQKVVYMEDLDRGTIVHFLSNATIDFTMPSNVRSEMPDTDIDIFYVMSDYEYDVERYLTSEGND